MATLVLSAETSAIAWEDLGAVLQQELSGWIDSVAQSEAERAHLLRGVKAKLMYSPFTGRLASLALLDVERDVTAIYYVSEGDSEDSCTDGVYYKPRSEQQLLLEFWEGAARYSRFVTCNGRRFLVPFLLHRSAMLGVIPTVDLLETRYLERQRGVQHVDLLDQFTFDGAWERRPSLRLLCQAYGVALPPSRPEVMKALLEQDSAAISHYTNASAISVTALYTLWQTYFSPLKDVPYDY